MDAKPQRPTRAFRAHDENVPIVSNGTKTLHQRNKSTPALSTLLGPGGVKNAVKRTAFGDVSNTVNAVRVAKDDSSISSKATTTAPDKPVALSRPAQRANSVLGTKALLKDSTNTNTVSGPTKSATTLDKTQSHPRKITTKRSNVVFKDPALPSVTETAATSAPKTSSTQITEDTAAKQEVTDVSVTKHRPLPDLPKPAQSQQTGNASDVRHSSSGDSAYSERNGDPKPHDCRSGIANSQETNRPGIKMETNVAAAVSLRPNGVSHVDSATSNGFKHEHLAPSEPEEYFDDDEDENYEDDGYVTARSHRSRSDNTTGAATTILFPKVTQQVKRELAVAKQIVESTRTVEDVEEECWDTSMVAEYGEEIFDYMRDLEMRLLPNAHYMDNQAEIQWSMRSVLMDWIVQVHHRFALLPETLFLCVNYIDRFLSCKIVSLGKLQLVGATAIFIAAKYEEINCPSLQEIVYMVDNGYSADEILKAERFMLSMLQFELGWPGPMSFLRRISKADDYDLETRTLAKYFLEITIMDERFVGTPPSFTAAGAHCLARLMLRKGNWSHAHVHYSGYTYSQLYPLVSMILECCDNPQKHHLAVYEKYTDRKFKRASYFVEGEVMKGFQLPEVPRENSASHLIDLFDNVSAWRRA